MLVKLQEFAEMSVAILSLLVMLSVQIICDYISDVDPYATKLIAVNNSNGEIIDTDRSGYLFIRYGEPLELLCMGRADKLKMELRETELKTEVINETTIRWFEEKPEEQINVYICKHHEMGIFKLLLVIIGSNMVKDFSCKSKNLKFLNCTWTVPEFAPYVSVFVMEDANPVLKSKNEPYCLFPVNERNTTFNFLVNTCYSNTCTNQTYAINHYSVLKPNPPESITLTIASMMSLQSVYLEWSIPDNLTQFITEGFDSRVEYWYSGIDYRQVNTSIINQISPSTFQLEFKQPCARTDYVVRISIRPKEAVEEEFWSDYEYIDFSTSHGFDLGSNTIIDPSCTICSNTQILDYEMYLLRRKIKEEQMDLKEKINELKTKADLI
ncbi:uncharacterized protein [Choristoneura fumiferana]|uniref:uncharacterized protein n=1 Tax=Choristoneura fumiferana TaxID=7141 RepID=UPI003D154022